MYDLEFVIQVVRFANRNTIYKARKQFNLDHKTVKRWIELSKKDKYRSQRDNLEPHFRRKEQPKTKRLTKKDFENYCSGLKPYQHIYLSTFETSLTIDKKPFNYITVAHDFASGYLNFSISSSKAQLHSSTFLHHIKQYCDNNNIKEYNFIFDSGKRLSNYPTKIIDKFKWIVRERLRVLYTNLYNYLLDNQLVSNSSKFPFIANCYLYLLKRDSYPDIIPILVDDKGIKKKDSKDNFQLTTLNSEDKIYIGKLVNKQLNTDIENENKELFPNYKELLASYDLKLKIDKDRKNSLFNKSKLLANMGIISDAEIGYKKWLKLFKENSRQKVDLYKGYGTLLLSCSRYDDAMDKFKLAFRFGKKLDYHDGVIDALYYITSIHTYQNNYKLASFYIKKLNRKALLTKSYNSYKRYYSVSGLYKSTFKSKSETLLEYKILLELAKKEKDLITQIHCYSNIGKLYLMDNKYRKALSSLKQTVKLKENIGHKLWTASSYKDLADIYMKLERYNLALENSKIALKHSEELGNTQLIFLSHLSLSVIYIKKKEFKKSIFHWLRSYYNMDKTTEQYYSVLKGNIKYIISQYRKRCKEDIYLLTNNKTSKKVAQSKHNQPN